MKTAFVSATVVAMSVATWTSLLGQTDTARIAADIRFLADDAREGRGVGTAGLDTAATYIAQAFRDAGLEPVGTSGYFQHFQLDPSAPALAHSGIGAAEVRNVVAVIRGTGGLAGETVVVGAHYDHLGRGGAGSRDPDSVNVIHNGADDNASGTAALLEVARLLNTRTAPDRRTIVFVAFTAEELGLLGSNHYVKQPARPIESTYAMVNFDMVGRLRDDAVIAIGTGSATEFPALLDSLNGNHGLVVKHSEDPWGRSDHSSFYGEGIPVLHFFTDLHDDYHRTTDDWQTINIAGIARVAAYAADLTWELARRPNTLSYVDVPQPPQMTSGGYGAYLGSIPDMSESPGGVRLTGVREGSPADAAGLTRGDILVQIGDHEFTDLYGMTDALRAHRPGDQVLVAFMRDGKRVETTVTLGRRGG